MQSARADTSRHPEQTWLLLNQRHGVLQLRQTTGQEVLQLHAGDTVALSTSAATLEAVAADGSSPDDWLLATLHLVFDAGAAVTVGGEPSSPASYS